MSKNRILLILGGIILGLALLYTTAIATEVQQDCGGGDHLGVELNYKTELLDPQGKVIQVQPLLNRLTFYSGSSTVSAMRVTVDWTASGRDVDWSTLALTVEATGTGGYTVSLPFSTHTGSAEISLPISTGQLGRTPSSGETVTWTVSVDVSGEIKDAVGNTVTATADTVTSSLTTEWYVPFFTIDTSSDGTSTTTPPPSDPDPTPSPDPIPSPDPTPSPDPAPYTPPPYIPPGGPVPLGILRTWTTP